MRSRTVCQKGMGRSLPWTQLPLPRLPHFPVPPCPPGLSLVSLCYPICNGSRVESFLSSTAACSPLGLPHLTLAPGPVVPGSTGVQYCTSQPALLRLPAHFRQIGQIYRPAGVMYNAPHNLWLSAVSCHPIFFLTDLQFISHPPPSLSSTDVEVDKGAVSCNLRRIGQA